MKNIAIKIKYLITALTLGAVILGSNVQAQSGIGSFTDIYLQSGANFAVHNLYAFGDISGSLDGMLYTQRDNPAEITFGENSSWFGAGNDGCVDGYAKKYGSTPFTYPVGDNGAYRPIALSNPGGVSVAYFGVDPNSAVTSNAFGGSSYSALPVGGPFSTSSYDNNLRTISSDEYWHVDGSTNSKVTLSWDSNSDLATLAESDLENLTIVGWDGSEWVEIESEIDIFALDNEAYDGSFSSTASNITLGSITSKNNVDLSNYSIFTFGCLTIYRLEASVFLSGCYNTSAGLMYDSLRSKGYIPTSEPYGAYSNFTHYGNGGDEKIPSASASSILGVTGSNAIVDWVFIELRSSSDSSVVIETQSALVQRDGDIVKASNGTGKVKFVGLSNSDYYVSIRHRNHMGVMTEDTETLTYSGTTVDFTDGNASGSGEFDFGTGHPIAGSSFNYSGLAQKAISSSVRALWAGDGNQDGKVKYTAPNDDVNTLLADVLLFPSNTSFSYNYNNAFGYKLGDYDMNGKAKFTAPGDDVNTILFNLLLYPLNTGYSYNYNLFLEQLP
jgi:hypothetical protein